jgi:short-subunit dehydrogenase
MNNIVITGASRGIGLELAKAFKSDSTTVYTINRSETEECHQASNHSLFGAELTDPNYDKKILNFLEGVQIDVLIHNAGLMIPQSWDSFSPDEARRQFEVNTLAPLRISHCLRSQIPQGGKLCFITSRMGSIADNTSGGSYGYRMSKAALNAGVKSLALDLKDEGVMVRLIHPGWVKTRMTNQTGHLTPMESAQAIKERIAEMSLDNNGSFVHSNGEALPW